MGEEARMIQVRPLAADADPSAWDEYVRPRAGSVTDLVGWRRVVHDAYGMDAHFLMAREAGRVVGALALFEPRHPLFGHALTTAAFGTDGGLHADSPAAREALVAAARQLATRRGVDYLLIRTRGVALAGFSCERRYRTSVIDLAPTVEKAWQGLPSKTRNQVRRGLKEGFQVARGPEQIEPFHAVFHRHMRDLGSPAHSLGYYQAIQRHLGERAEFLVVRDGGTLVGGALLLWTSETAMNIHTVALRRFNRRCPNYLLYWTMIEDSLQRGLRHLDLGRSERDSPQLAFKLNWAPRELELCYNYWLVKARALPRLSPRDPRFRLASAVWRHLPLSVTRALGPRLISGIV